MSPRKALPKAVQESWHGFLETYEPLRPDLYRYCRHLTRSAWDAEDLAQDAMARAFVTLGQLGEPPPNPRAWLFRVASNLWIDRVRRRRAEHSLDFAHDAAPTQPDPQGAREAAGTLLGRLSPQERAAVVLKDVFDFSLAEAAEALSTTVGAVKAALSRGRGKLTDPPPEPLHEPAPAALDAFCRAFNAGDLDGVTALLLDTAEVDVVGATTRYGPAEARRTVLFGMLFGVRMMVRADEENRFELGRFDDVVERAPRVEARCHRGEWLLLHWYDHQGGEAVRAITRLRTEGDRIARLQNYFYAPELVAEVCGELGLSSRSNGRRWWRRID